MEQPDIWEEHLPITASMVNHQRRCKLDALCNVLQEIAGRHANALKVGFFEMQQEQLFWALSRLRVELRHTPSWQETIRIRTWVHRMRGPLSFRNFTFHTEDDQILGSASTLWTSVHTLERKPIRLPFTDFPVRPDDLPPCGEPERLRIPAQIERETTYTVRYSDIDMIGHVNNVRYLSWLLDTYGSYNLKHQPVRVDINYLGETKLGDSVLLQRFKDVDSDNLFHHRIVHAGEDKEILRATIEWEARCEV
jgi:medium-chain acyl-[acyl-carrier-protein] hydrolase